MKKRYVKFTSPGNILVVPEKHDTSGCEVIEVPDSDFSNSGSPSWWVNDGGTIRVPNQTEKDQRSADEAAKFLEDAITALYSEAMAYQRAPENIDDNLLAEMTKSESLFESGKATESDLPLAKANGDWLEGLWAVYYTEKTKLLAGDSYSLDFSSYGNVPHDFSGVRAERKVFLAL